MYMALRHSTTACTIGIVARVDGLDDEQAEPRPAEHRLHDDRAVEQRHEQQGGEGHHRQRGVLEGVLPDDLPLGQPLDARQLHVLAAEHVEHGRAGEPHEPGHREPAERDAGQQDVQRGAAAGGRQQVQEHAEDEHEQQAQPERRHGLAERREGARGVVEPAPAPDRGVDADRQRDGDDDEHGEAAELERGAVALERRGPWPGGGSGSDWPKSPWSARVRNHQYCTAHGRSRPRCARIGRDVLLRRLRPAP